jgi:EAL and modified HD-GYP domain-containing signal transduction protein
MEIEEARRVTPEGADVPAASAPDRLLARQSILNGRCEVVGYELLFREGWESCFDGKATKGALEQCLYMGTELATGNKLTFVNCMRESIVRNLVTLLPPATTVIEITASGEVDTELLEACIRLRKMGYRFALDDFAPHPHLKPLVEIADYLKVDFRRSDAYTRQQTYRMACYSGTALVANKLEDQQQFQAARSEGYEYFQGMFFCQPTIVAGREIGPSRIIYLRLLAALNQTTLNLREVTDIVQLEPSLSYRVLRLANSAICATQGKVTSITAAFILVGEERFRTLVSVAASCALTRDHTPALTSLSLERARFCELAAPLVGESPGEQFMLGLLSLLDAMLEMPMETIAKSLPLRGEAKEALLGAKNRTAVPLSLIRSFESGAWEQCASAGDAPAIDEETLTRLYVEAVKWAADSMAAGL